MKECFFEITKGEHHEHDYHRRKNKESSHTRDGDSVNNVSRHTGKSEGSSRYTFQIVGQLVHQHIECYRAYREIDIIKFGRKE
jgi:hypothetical protein